MQTLVELFRRFDALGEREAVGLYNGYHTRKITYAQLAAQARAAAALLRSRGLIKGDRVLLWAPNSPEWAAAFWGCILIGAPVVPLDARSSPEFVQRVARQANVKLALSGEGLEADVGAAVLRLGRIERASAIDISENIGPDDIAEIVFTSGSTSEPQGVVHRHRNICSNLTGVDNEIGRYRGWARPFQPLRILDLLPLSHLFGQTMGLFIAPLVGGAALFTTQLSAPAMLDVIRRDRVSVLVAAPQMAAHLRDELARRSKREPRPLSLKGVAAIAESWWRHRDIHRLTGWKFWALVVGGASLDESVEEFYRRVGFAVIQGYGLTEASPVVAVNHPFSTRKGSIGKALPGQEVRLAPDGEILVRGASVAVDYLGQEAGAGKVRDGWLHTGDIGEIDAEGRLYFRGRKSDVIVRPDGLNVFPGDIEAVLNREPDVAECTAVGVDGRVHAALVLHDDAREPGEIVAAANRALDSSQRIQDWSVWRSDELPRTTSTMKIRRGELAERIAGRAPAPKAASPIDELLGEAAATDPDADLDLSSLERVELLAQAEERVGRELDEQSFSQVRTVGELQNLLAGQSKPASKPAHPWLLEPRWNRSWLVRQARRAAQEIAIFPLSGLLIEIETIGLANLEGLRPPVLFIANHASHFDTLVVLRSSPEKLAPPHRPGHVARLFCGPIRPLGRLGRAPRRPVRVPGRLRTVQRLSAAPVAQRRPARPALHRLAGRCRLVPAALSRGHALARRPHAAVPARRRSDGSGARLGRRPDSPARPVRDLFDSRRAAEARQGDCPHRRSARSERRRLLSRSRRPRRTGDASPGRRERNVNGAHRSRG